MELDRIIGQERQVEFLKRMAGSEVRRSYLFHGPEGSGKGYAAGQFAQDLAGDPNVVRASYGRDLTIEGVRDFVRWLEIEPYVGRYKVIVIQDVDGLSVAASNVSLKAMEDNQGAWVLTTSYYNQILDTVKSRCFPILFREYTEDQLYMIARRWGYVEKDARDAAHEAAGSVRLMRRILEGEMSDAEAIVERVVDAVSKKKLARLVREFQNFRGADSRALFPSFFDLLLMRSVDLGWPVPARDLILEAAGRIRSGGSVYLTTSVMLMGLGRLV